ncbi:hypothetical protein [Stackebrandtia soli]|uniref:hypothetical protein n=1 Tax=Stackebrandtia soli TaxID=1892856 RepID=UPI0039EAB5DB
MKRMLMRGSVAAAAVVGIVAAATPAHAADPALVDCSFAGVYTSYDATGGTGLKGYANRDTELTVEEGNGHAWLVEVETGFLAGTQGWIETDCVVFLA